MPLSLRIKRGLLADIPALANGEFYYATDTNSLYIGESGNVLLTPASLPPSDGDKGDIIVSSSGTVWTIDSSIITAAARTVLDDTTVAAMVNTLGGATSSGTGGLVRISGATLAGVPLAPTASPGTNTTQIATTAFVTAAAAGSITVGAGQLVYGDGVGAPVGSGDLFRFSEASLVVKGLSTAQQSQILQQAANNNTNWNDGDVFATHVFTPRSAGSLQGGARLATIKQASSSDTADAATFTVGQTDPTTNTVWTARSSGKFKINSASTASRILTTDANGNVAVGSVGESGLTPLASPAFTGVPTAPTASPGTNSTQIATTSYADAAVAAAVTGLLEMKGSTDCSANPNYPVGLKGDLYYVTVAGKIGGASGKSVDIGDVYVASADNAGGTEASVGTSWFVLEHNLSGVLLTSAIGSTVQAYDADLTTWATLTPSANAQSLVIAANYAAMRALLDLEAGTDFYSISAADALLAAKAPLASPALTGVPTAPTATPGTNTTQIATTAFVAASGGGVPTTITVADSTDTTCFVALFEDATGNLAPKTDAGVTYNASTGALTATALVGPLTGNVTGNVSGSSGSCTGNAATVTTNANLTGPVTSSGNATSLAADFVIPTVITVPNTGLHLLDTNASHDLIVKPGSDLTADRTLTVTTGDADRTLTISASTTLGGGIHSGTNTGDQTNITGNAATVTVADAAADTTTWPMLATSQTGSLAPATDAGLTYNASTNTLATTTFVGNLSGNADSVAVEDVGVDTTTWVLLATSQTGSLTPATDSGLTYNASINALTATTFIGALSGTANNVTTNANLTGPITSTGNATAVAAQTGTGSTFVMAASPTITTPAFTGLPTGSGVASAATASTLAARDANANLSANNYGAGFTTTAMVLGTTTLTVASTYIQVFTGAVFGQTVVLPVVTTLTNGHSFRFINLGVGTIVTVQTSAGTVLFAVSPGTDAIFTCVDTAGGTGVASWRATYSGFAAKTGSGGVVLEKSPTLTTPDLGVPTAGDLVSCTNYPATALAGVVPVANLPGDQVYVGSFTRNMATATGTQAITGVGFTPKALVGICCTTVGGAVQASWSGVDDGVTRNCLETGYYLNPGISFIWRVVVAGANYQSGYVSAWGADGFTVTWTKAGTPTGTATVTYIAIR